MIKNTNNLIFTVLLVVLIFSMSAFAVSLKTQLVLEDFENGSDGDKLSTDGWVGQWSPDDANSFEFDLVSGDMKSIVVGAGSQIWKDFNDDSAIDKSDPDIYLQLNLDCHTSTTYAGLHLATGGGANGPLIGRSGGKLTFWPAGWGTETNGATTLDNYTAYDLLLQMDIDQDDVNNSTGTVYYRADGDTVWIIDANLTNISLGCSATNNPDTWHGWYMRSHWNSFVDDLELGTGIAYGDANSTELWPTDGISGVSTDVELTWTPGVFAEKHNVYLGTSSANVTSATTSSDEYQGQVTSASYDTTGLKAFEDFESGTVGQTLDQDGWSGAGATNLYTERFSAGTHDKVGGVSGAGRTAYKSFGDTNTIVATDADVYFKANMHLHTSINLAGPRAGGSSGTNGPLVGHYGDNIAFTPAAGGDANIGDSVSTWSDYEILLQMNIDQADYTNSTGTVYYRSLGSTTWTKDSNLQDVDLGLTAACRPAKWDNWYINSSYNGAWDEMSLGVGDYNDMEILQSGTTYYWRIDDYNDANNIFKGDVHSFTTGEGIASSDTQQTEMTGTVTVPIHYSPYYYTESNQYDYNPRFDPGAATFDSRNRPYILDGTINTADVIEDSNKLVVLTLNHAGRWIELDPTPAIYKLYPEWDGEIDEVLNKHIVFDDDDDAYLHVLANSTPLLLHSTDYCRNWTAYEVPFKGRLERRDGHNDIKGPPAMISNVERTDTSDLDLLLPTKSGGVLTIPSAITIEDVETTYITPKHTGNGNVLVTSGNMTHIVYMTYEDLTGHVNEAPCYAVSYNHDTPGFVTDPCVIGFCDEEDEHNGPVITIDSADKLHVIIGAHHDQFKYSDSNEPNSTWGGWSAATDIGTTSAGGGYTYTGLVCDDANTLHLISRWAGDGYVFKLSYMFKTAGGSWDYDHDLVDPNRAFYGNWFCALNLDRDDRLMANYMHYFNQLDRGTEDGYDEHYKQYWPEDDIQLVDVDGNWWEPVMPHDPAILFSDDSGSNWDLAITSDLVVDLTCPSPDTGSFDWDPCSTGTTSIAMKATNATDAAGVEYYFDCTAGGGNDSGWQSDPNYTDTGLTAGTQYTYRCKARDLSYSQNETKWSSTASATTDKPDVALLGSWGTGTSHTAEAGSNRALVFTAHAEDNDSVMRVSSVTYGGQAMTRVIDQNTVAAGYHAHTGAFVLDDANIADASSSTFVVTWSSTSPFTSPSRTPDYTHAFFSNVDQATLTGDEDGNYNTSTDTIQTDALTTSDGDMVIVSASCGKSGSYTTDNSFTKGTECAPTSADGVSGYKSATGANETPKVTFSSSANRQTIVGFVLNKD